MGGALFGKYSFDISSPVTEQKETDLGTISGANNFGSIVGVKKAPGGISMNFKGLLTTGTSYSYFEANAGWTRLNLNFREVNAKNTNTFSSEEPTNDGQNYIDITNELKTQQWLIPMEIEYRQIDMI